MSVQACLFSESAVWALLVETKSLLYFFQAKSGCFSSDGQPSEIMDRACSSRHLSAGVLEQLRRRVPPQTGESREQRVTGGLGQIPGCCQALRQPHHQAEVSKKEGWNTTLSCFLGSGGRKSSFYNKPLSRFLLTRLKTSTFSVKIGGWRQYHLTHLDRIIGCNILILIFSYIPHLNE